MDSLPLCILRMSCFKAQIYEKKLIIKILLLYYSDVISQINLN